MCEPNSPPANEGMGAGLEDRTPNPPYTSDLEMFPPECLLLCPLPHLPTTGTAGNAAGPPETSLNLLGSDVRFSTRSITAVFLMVLATSSATEAGLRDSVEGALVILLGGRTEVEYCSAG